jgi:adenine/guanine phosphoribosyltransferase-like PRPP-binding protein
MNYCHEDREILIDRICEKLEQHSHKFDAIAVSGSSMQLISSVVAYKMKKNVILVRKLNEICYSDKSVEGKNYQKYIIIDDFCESGRTINYVISQISFHLSECTPVAYAPYLSQLTDNGIEFISKKKLDYFDLTDTIECGQY